MGRRQGSGKGSRIFFFFLIFKTCSNNTESMLVIIPLFKWDHMHSHYFKKLENAADNWKIFKNLASPLGDVMTASTFLVLFRSLKPALAKIEFVLEQRVYK